MGLVAKRMGGYRRLVAAIIDQLAQSIVDAYRLEYTDTPLKAGLVAMLAAGLAVDHCAVVEPEQ